MQIKKSALGRIFSLGLCVNSHLRAPLLSYFCRREKFAAAVFADPFFVISFCSSTQRENKFILCSGGVKKMATANEISSVRPSQRMLVYDIKLISFLKQERERERDAHAHPYIHAPAYHREVKKSPPYWVSCRSCDITWIILYLRARPFSLCAAPLQIVRWKHKKSKTPQTAEIIKRQRGFLGRGLKDTQPLWHAFSSFFKQARWLWQFLNFHFATAKGKITLCASRESFFKAKMHLWLIWEVPSA